MLELLLEVRLASLNRHEFDATDRLVLGTETVLVGNDH